MACDIGVLSRAVLQTPSFELYQYFPATNLGEGAAGPGHDNSLHGQVSPETFVSFSLYLLIKMFNYKMLAMPNL